MFLLERHFNQPNQSRIRYKTSGENTVFLQNILQKSKILLFFYSYIVALTWVNVTDYTDWLFHKVKIFFPALVSMYTNPEDYILWEFN